jgi:hypothetical protein
MFAAVVFLIGNRVLFNKGFAIAAFKISCECNANNRYKKKNNNILPFHPEGMIWK